MRILQWEFVILTWTRWLAGTSITTTWAHIRRTDMCSPTRRPRRAWATTSVQTMWTAPRRTTRGLRARRNSTRSRTVRSFQPATTLVSLVVASLYGVGPFLCACASEWESANQRVWHIFLLFVGLWGTRQLTCRDDSNGGDSHSWYIVARVESTFGREWSVAFLWFGS